MLSLVGVFEIGPLWFRSCLPSHETPPTPAFQGRQFGSNRSGDSWKKGASTVTQGWHRVWCVFPLLKKVSHEFDEKVPCLSINPGCLLRFLSRELVWDDACKNKARHRWLFKNWDCPISQTFFVVVNLGEISFLQQKTQKSNENPKNFYWWKKSPVEVGSVLPLFTWF